MRRSRSFTAVASATVLVLAAAAPAGPTHAAALAMLRGVGATGIQIVNLDPARSAMLVFDHYRHGHGALPAEQVSRPGLPPGGVTNLFPPLQPEMAPDVYGVRLTSDRAIGAVVRTDWSQAAASMLYNAMRPATDVVVPLFLKRMLGQDAAIAVMIDGDSAADVELTLWGADGAQVLRQTYAFEGWEARILPLHAASPPTIGFVGWASLRSTAPLAAVGLVDARWSAKGAYAYEGVPRERLGDTLYAPFVRRSQLRGGPESVTLLWLTNPGDRTVRASVRFDGNAGACAGQIYHLGPRDVAPHAIERIDPRAAGLLPANCAASAMVVADGVIAAVAVDSADDGRQVAAYTAAGAADAATRVALPMVRRQHTAMKFTTTIAVQNAGTAPATVDLAFRDDKGVALTSCGQPCRVVLGPGAARLFQPSAALNGLPVGSYGSAVLTSDQPVAAIVDDVSETGAYDASIYSGIPSPDDAPAATMLAPFVLKGSAVDFAPTVMQRFFPWAGANR